jgi:hypothetical protein
MQGPSSYLTIIANKVIVQGTDEGVFIYTGTPVLGNPPVLAIVSPGTTEDPYGNTVTAILSVGQAGNPQVVLNSSGGVGTAEFPTGSSTEANPAEINSLVSGTVLVLTLGGATSTGAADSVYIQMDSNNSAGSSSALGVLVYKDKTGVTHVALQWDDTGVHVEETLYGTGGVLTVGDTLNAEQPVIAGQGVYYASIGEPATPASDCVVFYNSGSLWALGPSGVAKVIATT